MGREAIRQVATQYFQDVSLPMVGTVFAARPYIVQEQDYDVQMAGALLRDGAFQDSSAVLIVNVPKTHREAATITGRAAVNDKEIHSLVLELYLANTAGDAVGAQLNHDQICDAIVKAIRDDPLLGQPGTVWSAGEFTVGVDVDQHEPFWNSDGTTVFIVADIRFETWQWIAGNVDQ